MPCPCCRRCDNAIQPLTSPGSSTGHYAPLLDGHPDLDDIIAFDRNALRGGFGSMVAESSPLFSRAPNHRFDLVIDLQGLTAHRRHGLGQRRCAADRSEFRP